MEFFKNLISPILVAVLPVCVIGFFTLLFKSGKRLYVKRQERITNSKLKMHKGELSVRLGGLIETSKAVKEFFAAYDYLYRQAKDKPAEHFIDKIDTIIAAIQEDESSQFGRRVIKVIIANAEEKGYQRKFITAAEAQEITETKMRICYWENAFPDKIKITLKG